MFDFMCNNEEYFKNIVKEMDDEKLISFLKTILNLKKTVNECINILEKEIEERKIKMN